MKYVFIENKRAGTTCCEDKLLSQIKDCEQTFDYEIYATCGKGDAINFVKDYCAIHENDEICFVACGGDGTINEVVNGIMGQENKSFAVLAFGSGNDFIKYYPECNFLSVSDLINGTLEKIDVIKVNDRYSVNMVNIGFDGMVAVIANKLKEKGAKKPYQKGILRALLRWRYNKIEITADREKITKKKMLLCSLANGKYCGGKYFTAPFAKNNDGFIELALIHPMSLISFARFIKYYENGEYLTMQKLKNKVCYKRVKHVEITTEKDFSIVLDGEELTSKNFVVDIIEKGINLIIPKRNNVWNYQTIL